MTHMKPVDDDHDGVFSPWRAMTETCARLVGLDGTPISQARIQAAAIQGRDVARRCDATVEGRRWESHDGGYEDWQYRCAAGHTWWVEGPDA